MFSVLIAKPEMNRRFVAPMDSAFDRLRFVRRQHLDLAVGLLEQDTEPLHLGVGFFGALCCCFGGMSTHPFLHLKPHVHNVNAFLECGRGALCLPAPLAKGRQGSVKRHEPFIFVLAFRANYELNTFALKVEIPGRFALSPA